jgi:hypothetical protein
MTILTIPALLLVATVTPAPLAEPPASQAAPAPVIQAEPASGPYAGPPAYRAFTPPPAYRPHTPPPAYRAPTPPVYYRSHRSYRSYRSYRSRPSYRNRTNADNYLKKGGLTFTARGGHHDLIGEPGAFELLEPRGSFGFGYGWNISPFVHFGLGVDGLVYGQEGQRLGPVKGLAQINVISDLTFRLLRPSERHLLVPFLQLGMGLGVLSGTVKKTVTTEGCDGAQETTESSKSTTLARGGIFQIGGGLEIWLTRAVSLDLRALYRVQPMSGLRCLEGAACDRSTTPSQVTLHGFLADVALTVHFGGL